MAGWHTVGTSSLGRAPGSREPGLCGGICLAVLFVPASCCRVRGDTCSCLVLGQGRVWAAGGWATYPVGVASSPEAPHISKDVAGSRIPEKGQSWAATRTHWVSHHSNLKKAVVPEVTQEAPYPALPSASTVHLGQKPGSDPNAHPTFPKVLPSSLPHAPHCLPWLRSPCSPRTHLALAPVLKERRTNRSCPCPAPGGSLGIRPYDWWPMSLWFSEDPLSHHVGGLPHMTGTDGGAEGEPGTDS